jgi:uncharacterized protein YgbK (DUF1537 family)
MRLGVIADDFTGSVDIAGFLVAGGMRTIMCSRPVVVGDSDAIVMSLKIRSIPKSEAVKQVLEALAFLQQAGATGSTTNTVPPSIVPPREISARSPMP